MAGDHDQRLRAFFRTHVEAVTSGDVDAVLRGYAPDATLIHADGIVQGADALRRFYAETIAAAAGLDPEWNVLVARDTIFAVWTVDGATGCETLLMRDGAIAVHTGFSTR